ncbi:hypothetical protein [Zavarzinia sp. CC-PAN008]|uniref:hypothetical protein n=1 Tax=Zavarzinia sp. CC-PAN008 TaxID=3243332 RepID=UPI003F748F63
MSGTQRRAGLSLSRIFAVPLLLVVVTLVGLVSALVGNGPADALSWAALGALVLVMAWSWLKPGAPRT